MSIEKAPLLDEVRLWTKADLKRMQRDHGYTAEDIEACVQAYHARRPAYEEVLKRLARDLITEDSLRDQIHSIRVRTKDYYHLIDKLRRKCLEEGKTIRVDDLFTFGRGITDLGGVRILHLYKYQWRPIHRYLTVCLPKYLHATLVERRAWRRHDEKDEDYISTALEDGFERDYVKPNKNNYTSLHYVYKFGYKALNDIYIECQVRTLFEEGWGEIDHQRKYPHDANDITTAQLGLLNKAVSVADAIASSFEQIDRLPVFVPWKTELEYERNATTVHVLSRDLRWAAMNTDKLKDQLSNSDTVFSYFFPRNADPTVTTNKDKIKNACHEFLGSQLKLLAVKENAMEGLPFFSDILLLDDTSDARRRRRLSLAVVGTPASADAPETQRLDMLIDDQNHVARLKKLFKDLENEAEEER